VLPLREIKKFVKIANTQGVKAAIQATPNSPHQKEFQEETQNLFTELVRLSEENECDLLYEQQVPNTGIVLIKGQLTLLKKKKIEKEISAGGMIGVYNLINNNPSSVTCKVQGDSELIMLQTLAS